MKDIIGLPEIKEQYKQICDILKDCHTVEDARRLEKKLGLFIELGNSYDVDADHCTLAKFDDLPSEKIEWFRVEAWYNLGYLYYYTNGDSPYFDVFEDGAEDPFLNDVTIKTIDGKYEEYLDRS